MPETTEAVQEQTQQDQTQQPQNNAQQQAEQTGTDVKSAQFPEAQQGNTRATNNAGVDILLGMTLPIRVSIGQTVMSVQKLLQLGPGSVVQLDKSVDEPVELYLKDVKFATGEVVVADGRFGVRIKEIFGINGSNRNAAAQ